MLTRDELARYKSIWDTEGYAIVRGLIGDDEVRALREHYMSLRRAGRYKGDLVGTELDTPDPLQQYPRMIHMHRWDARSLEFLIDARINQCLTAFLGVEPLACQTMLYFKPPGARGQALHQDNFYLRVSPGTCAAAWLALDDCDDENGCMQIVPGSHTWDLLCTVEADKEKSFTDVMVPIPDSVKPVSCIMRAGDVLFFNGQSVHGSLPNKTTDRFRRSLIAHYINGHAEKVTPYDKPVLKMDGTPVEIADAEGGGSCGVWVDVDGVPVIETAGVEAKGLMRE